MKNHLTPSKALLFFCLSFCLGVFLSSFLNFSLVFIIFLLIFFLILIGLFYHYWQILIFSCCVLFLSFGVFRAEFFDLNSQNNIQLLFQKEASLKALVAEEPVVSQNNTELTVVIKEFNGKPVKDLGKTLILTENYPKYKYADLLEISGRVTPPKNLGEFNYKDYLKKDKIYSLIYFPEIKVVSQNNYTNVFENFYGKVLTFKESLRDEINKKLPSQEAALLSSIILGDRSQFSTQFKNKINVTGLSHITAISGMNIILLSQILFLILLNAGFWRKQSLAMSLGLTWLYIVLIGFQPSAVRAGIMASLLNLAGLFDRQSISIRSIIFAATIMLAFNPLLLTKDIGFQLSFLATLGIIVFNSYFNSLFKKIPQKFGLREVLAMTASAQILTLPVLIYNFGYISIVSPITNVLVVPIIPYIMFFGILFSLTGIVFPVLGWFFSLPCLALLVYFTSVINFFSAFPVALKVSFGWLIIFYLVLFFFFFRYKKRSNFLLVNNSIIF